MRKKDIEELREILYEAWSLFSAYTGKRIPVRFIVDPGDPDYNDSYTGFHPATMEPVEIVIGLGSTRGKNPDFNAVAILAHEFGHVMRDQEMSNFFQEEKEFAADEYAVMMLYRNGMVPGILCDVLCDIARSHGYTIFNDNLGGHPRSVDRIKRIEKIIRNLG